MVPEGWEISKLADLAEVKRGAGSQYITYVDDPADGIRLIRIGDFLGDNSKFVVHTKDMDRFILKADDILIAGTGATAGITFEIPKHFEGFAFSYNAPRIRSKKSVNKTFLVNFLKSEEIKKQQHSLFTGNAQPFLDTKAIGGFKIATPPLPEQRKIADILSTWDQAIEKTEGLLSNARTQKRALMQQLLTGKRRFPAYQGQPWKEVRLGDVADVDAKSLSSKTPDDFEFEYISLSNVEPGRVIGKLDRLVYGDAPSRAKRIVQTGDLLVSTVRPNLMGFARVTKAHSDCIASTGFAVVTPKNTATGSYLFHYLFSHHMKSQVHGLVVGSNYPAINSSDVKKLKINLPTPEEQILIGEILDDCDLECDHLSDNLEQLRTEKKALMQQLLTGKRRVAV